MQRECGDPDSATLEVGDYSSSDAQDVSRRFTKVIVPRPGFPFRCRSIKHFATPSISNNDLSPLVLRITTDDRSNIFDVVEAMGLEPTTSCLQSRCSSQLSYAPE